jgi:hypothetical protein
VPVLGLGLIGLGIIVIILAYLAAFIFAEEGPIPIGNWALVAGFVMMAGGLLLLSQWR